MKMMKTKKIFLGIGILLMSSLVNFAANAQKFGFVDANFILSKMPSYQKAQQEIDAFSAKAQQQVDAKFKEVGDLKLKYTAEEVLLTDDMKRDRKKEIDKKEQEAKEIQQKTFGYEGILFLKKQELINPIREELNKVLEKVARKNSLQVIYDKSSDFVILYLDPTHDYTDYVLEELGLGDPKDNPKKSGK
jgi:outer membrane protein